MHKRCPDCHSRKSLRLKGYNYSHTGAYFITICTNYRKLLFGEISMGLMLPNKAGEMIMNHWNDIYRACKSVKPDVAVVMPNHFHGIIFVGVPLVGTPLGEAQITCPSSDTRAPTRGAPTQLGDIIGAFKSITTNEYILEVNHELWPRFSERLWQRNFYEHIVRDEDELARIREYIVNNPYMWETDRENPYLLSVNNSCDTTEAESWHV